MSNTVWTPEIGWHDGPEVDNAELVERFTHLEAATQGWGTWTRRHGHKYDVSNVRCHEHSEFDADGFAVQGPNDPDGDRCTAPTVGRECEDCGRPT